MTGLQQNVLPEIVNQLAKIFEENAKAAIAKLTINPSAISIEKIHSIIDELEAFIKYEFDDELSSAVEIRKAQFASFISQLKSLIK
jgi:hypothetical protein